MVAGVGEIKPAPSMYCNFRSQNLWSSRTRLKIHHKTYPKTHRHLMAENLWAPEIYLETYGYLMADALLKSTGTQTPPQNPLVQTQFFTNRCGCRFSHVNILEWGRFLINLSQTRTVGILSTAGPGREGKGLLVPLCSPRLWYSQTPAVWLLVLPTIAYVTLSSRPAHSRDNNSVDKDITLFPTVNLYTVYYM
jgi:hypothetical protein